MRITLRWCMGFVVASALFFVIAENYYRDNLHTDILVVVLVGCVVGALFGLRAMRRPITSLIGVVSAWVLAHELGYRHLIVLASLMGCTLGWLIGGPIGLIAAAVRRAKASRHLRENAPKSIYDEIALIARAKI